MYGFATRRSVGWRGRGEEKSRSVQGEGSAVPPVQCDAQWSGRGQWEGLAGGSREEQGQK